MQNAGACRCTFSAGDLLLTFAFCLIVLNVSCDQDVTKFLIFFSIFERFQAKTNSRTHEILHIKLLQHMREHHSRTVDAH
ncbi:hypothetical protein LPB142_15630 [Rhodobacter xanthinilyticus]|uniref:Uncharacterized protein n=1 Tax=Rhodobacter xanthinilyticus TaxID=1850250 RepID=A0A1D9MFG2_9RHOB|nr:hypothetical protein LPB142_15630 [Rhodobacter xanthinilyticus]